MNECEISDGNFEFSVCVCVYCKAAEQGLLKLISQGSPQESEPIYPAYRFMNFSRERCVCKGDVWEVGCVGKGLWGGFD